jgi:hypothetical protein
MKKTTRVLYLAAGLLLANRPSPGQSTFGSVVGAATDKTGAVIAGAAIEVKNLDENTVRRTVSSDQGIFEILNLKPGRYEVTAKQEGFAVFKVPEFILEARQTRRVDVVFEVASVEQVMVVSDTAAAVNTENGTIADSKNFEQITRLPVNYRGGTTSPLSAIVTMPGVQQDSAGRFSIGGGLPAMIEFTLDGISTVNIRNNGANSNMYPSSELLGEFKVTAINNNAEFNQVSDVTVTSKSGTNDLHGSLFEYLQNRALDATIYGSAAKQAKVWNTFGGSLGGPLYLPKLYNGKNRTFFIGAYEGNRRPGSTAQQASVPTAGMRQGNLSGLPGGKAVDPLSGQPFPDNVIPASRLNPVAQTLLGKYYPLPNYNSGSTLANFRNLVSTPQSTDGFDARADHYLSSRQQIFGRISWKNLPTTAITSSLGHLLPPDSLTEYNRNLVLSHNFSIRPDLINEFRFGISRWTQKDTFPINGQWAVKTLGITGLDLSNHPESGAFPTFDFSDGTGFTAVGHVKDGPTTSSTTEYTDNLAWIRGKHTMKFGFDIRNLRYTDVQHFGGSEDFGQFTFNAGAFSGNAFADLLLGLPSTTYISITGPDLDSPASHYGLYAQDEWRATERLTVSYGLRWEVHPPFTETYGNITNFDRATGIVITPDKALAPAPGFLSSINACPGTDSALPCAKIVTASQVGLGEGLRKTYWRNLDPRFSLAYRPFGNNKTVLRGGIGVFTMTTLGPLAYALTGIHTADTRTFVNSLGPNGFLYVLPQAFAGGANAPAPGTGEFIVATQLDYRDPSSVQWNLTVERELAKETAVRVSYIGMNSYRLNSTVDLNQVAPSRTPYSPERRPFRNWGRILSRDNIAFANYQAMQVEINRRFGDGLFFQGGYTLAKNLGNVNGDAPAGFPSESGATLADRFNLRNIRGNLYGTRRNRLLVNAIYQLPFGRGRRMLRSASRGLNAVVGGWEVSTVTLIQSGPFQTPIISRTLNQANINAVGRSVTIRPDRVGNGNLSHPTPNRWYDISAFAPTPAGAGRVGNAGVGILRGPGTVAVAGGLGKSFAFREKGRLRLEATFTNLPNHPNFAPPAVNVSAPATFGKTTSVQPAENSGNRVGQLAMRIDF